MTQIPRCAEAGRPENGRRGVFADTMEMIGRSFPSLFIGKCRQIYLEVVPIGAVYANSSLRGKSHPLTNRDEPFEHIGSESWAHC